ncbi:MAG: 50S ribosomal protein L23 [bacterium]
MEIILKHHITEKVKPDKYVFKVAQKANKPEIKKAVEEKYKVDIIKINIINIKPKPRILRGIKGFKKGYKKAVITIKHGQKIETTEKAKSRSKPR